MTKRELIDEITTANDGLTKAQATRVVDAVLGSFRKALKNGERVSLMGFGTFQVKTRAARTARKPGTQETVQIPERNVVAFKPSKELNEQVSKR